jgi:hypothetical protein
MGRIIRREPGFSKEWQMECAMGKYSTYAVRPANASSFILKPKMSL